MQEDFFGTDAKTKKIFLVFLKIGAFAFGGVYSILTFLERELVKKRKWLSHDEFAESVAIGQLTPGAPIVNTGLFIGYTLRKLRGALATVVGLVLPSFVLVLIMAFIYIRFKDITLLKAMLKGVGAAVVGLITSVVYRMSRKILIDVKSIAFAITALIGLAVFKLNPIVLIIASAIAGFLFYGRSAKWKS